MNCTSSTIKSFLTIKEKCDFVSNNCSYEYINFYSFHYCVMKGSATFTTIIITLLLFILFFILSSTSDIFLSSAISKIVETFNINQSIAAATLLAFGNGAPDVISSLVASAEPEGISFAICSVMGTGLFITSFVLGLVVFKAKEIPLNPKMFNRNIILLIISLIFIIIFGIKKNMNLIDSFGLIAIYILNIILAFFDDKKKEENNNQNNELIGDEITNKEKNSNNNIKDINLIDESKTNYKKIELEQKNDSVAEFYKEYVNIPEEENYINNEILGQIKEDIKKEQETYITNKKRYSEIINENMIFAKIHFKKKYSFYKEIEWGETSSYWKLFYILIDLPLTFLRELSIPVSESKKWNKLKFCFMPLSNFVFISYVFKCKYNFIIYIFLL